jgi:hypothetical protein
MSRSTPPRPNVVPLVVRFVGRSGALLVALLAAGAGCKGGGDDQPGPEGLPDGAPAHDALEDIEPMVLAVDFTVTGCASYDVTKPQCRGSAPLTVTFVPITSGNVTRLLWDFGDGSQKENERTPTHTYTLPGSYSVQLTGTPGLPFQPHDAFIVATPNALGESCDVDSQCEHTDALTCVCGSACPAAFARGICSKSCALAGCPQGSACADLSLGAAAGTMDPWRAPLCLRSCTGDGMCPLGQRCRKVPLAGGSGTWTRACFVDFPRDLGATCRGANGGLQNELCLGGRCADLGALGVCSLDCSTKDCPAGTACAAFGDGRRLCLAPCADASSCHDDPLLGCVAPGGTGPLGFTVAGPPVNGATFCAPRACDTDPACAPAGICAGLPNGHCVRPAPTSRP